MSATTARKINNNRAGRLPALFKGNKMGMLLLWGILALNLLIS